MIHELREYIAVPGRAEDLHDRFATKTMTLFEEAGLDVRGFWHDADDRHRIVYLTRFDSVDEAKTFWARFTASPVWQQLKSATEQDGPLIESIAITYLATPGYVSS